MIKKISITITIITLELLAFANQATTHTETLLKNLRLPEGPAVDSKGNIWFVESIGNVNCLDTLGNFKRYPIDNGAPNGTAIDSLDRVWFCDVRKKCISILNPATGEIKKICEKVDGKLLIGPNDLAFDAKGNLIFTCSGGYRKTPKGYVCVVNSKGVKKIIPEMYFPNGIVVSPDGKRLAISETYKRRVLIGDWDDEKLEWTNPKVLIEVESKDGPDGMAFGSDGNLYITIYGDNVIKVVTPQGEIIKEINLKGSRVTNCAFLPNGGLLITETERGELLKFNTDVKSAIFKKSWLSDK